MENTPALLKKLVQVLKEHKGSDIHMLEGEPPRIRIRGDLRRVDMKDHPVVTRDDVQAILDSALTPDQKEDLEHKGDVDFSLYFSGATGRGNTGFANGRRLHFTMRYLPDLHIAIDDLGMDADMLKDISNSEAGLIVVAGETSSGKTTTIVAMLDHINHTRFGSITTIENPVEYSLTSDKCLITRRETGRDTPNFHEALRATVRKNPDVLLIGEIRDAETGNIALTAAETGILTFCTLHSVGAIPSITRLGHIMSTSETPDSEFYLRLSLVLRAIISQQLVKSGDGGHFLPIYEILNITDIEKKYIRDQDFERLGQSLESDRSISLGECVYRLWHSDPRSIDENHVRRIYGSRYTLAIQMLQDQSGYKALDTWL